MRIFFILSFTIILYSSDLDIKRYTKKYNLSEKLIKSIIINESGFKRYAIGINEKNKYKQKILKSFLIKNNIHFSKKNNLFSTNAKYLNKAYKLTIFLKKNSYDNYDIGLMQININNIKRNNFNVLRLLSDKNHNLDVGSKILNDCFNTFNKMNEIDLAIECYNKGNDRKKLFALKYDNNLYYFNKIAEIYQRGEM